MSDEIDGRSTGALCCLAAQCRDLILKISGSISRQPAMVDVMKQLTGEVDVLFGVDLIRRTKPKIAK